MAQVRLLGGYQGINPGIPKSRDPGPFANPEIPRFERPNPGIFGIKIRNNNVVNYTAR